MNRPFRFGVLSAYAPSGDVWRAQARRIEELGYATLLIPDRPSFPGFAPLTALAVAAAVTTTLRVGTHVFANDYRNPALLAKEIATLDLLSGGRFEFGIGAGVSPEDYKQMGIPFGSPGARVSRVEEAIQIVKRCWNDEVVNFSGKYYTITNMNVQPKPVQKPHPLIFVGSTGKRMLSIAAREANTIAPARRWGDPTDVPLEEKIGWIKDAAGERFASLELAQTIFDIEITDSQAKAVPLSGAPFRIPPRPMSTEQAVEHLLELRERYGLSYFQIQSGQMENFAPVAARLSGK
jgi:probable F420-dependent oxidoreductase